MAVRAAILDLDGTLITPNGQLVSGIRKMFTELRGAGLKLIVASNRLSEAVIDTQLMRLGIHTDLILDRYRVGANKGSPKWVSAVKSHFQLKANELVWLGDSDTDMRSAINGQVAYFNAEWSNPAYAYGIPAQTPQLFSLILRECFMKNVNWYWEIHEADVRGRRVVSYAMMDGQGAGVPLLKRGLLSFLKDSGDPDVGPLTVRELMMYHLVGSIYGSDLYPYIDTWTTYPGSQGTPNAVMGPFMKIAARLFRHSYVDNLIVRHKEALDSGRLRTVKANSEITFLNQMNTIRLNSEYISQIEDKRILVIDDFITWGYSSECARNFLYDAGAADVITVAIGKYGNRQYAIAVNADAIYNPYKAKDYAESDFQISKKAGTADLSALATIRNSYRRVSGV